MKHIKGSIPSLVRCLADRQTDRCTREGAGGARQVPRYKILFPFQSLALCLSSRYLSTIFASECVSLQPI